MNAAWVILAATADDSKLDHRLMRSASREIAAILFVALLLTIAFVVWAIFFRKPPRTGRRKHHREASPTEPTAPTEAGESAHRHRRRHRKHHRRNPTLAETGGLPPRRLPTDDPAPGSPSTASTPPTA